jgi:transporter family protein
LGYIGWVVIAMVGYGAMAAVLKVALRSIPPEVAVIINNFILVGAGILFAAYRGVKIPDHLSLNLPTLLLVVSGLLLSVSIISFYMALSRGPASIVVPIFGMNIAIVSILGFMVLGEPVNASRVLGIAMAGGSIFLLTR